MKNNPMRRYWIEGIIAAALVVVLVIVISATIPHPWTIVAAIAVALTYPLVVRWSAKRNLVSILTHEMDPDRFKAIVLSGKGFLPHPTYRAAHALYAGDYQTAVNIYSHYAGKYKTQAGKSRCLAFLARIYFELGDMENLNAVCNRYQGDKGMIPYYRAYAAGQYEQCIAICNEKDAKATAKQPPVGAVNSCLHYAFAYAKLGDRENACKYFSQIAKTAPKLYVATVAQNYLDGGDLPQVTAVLPQKDVSLDTPNLARRKKAMFLLTLLALLISILLPLLKPEDEVAEFNRKLDAAVAAEYTDYQILGCCWAEKDGEEVQTVCLIQSGDQIDVVSVHPNYDDHSFIIIKRVEDMQVGFEYAVQDTANHRQFLYSATTTARDSIDNTVSISFVYDNSTLWFNVACN